MKKRFIFTMATLAALKPPTDADRYYVYDAKRTGLALCVTRGGSRTWYLYRKVDGRPERVRLGVFPDLNVDSARTIFDGKVGEIAKGANPAKERRTIRAEMTLGELFTRYLNDYAKPHKRSWQADEDQFVRYFGSDVKPTAEATAEAKPVKPAPFSAWRSRRLSGIDGNDVQQLHAAIGTKHGKYAANRIAALLSKMFSFAGKVGWKGTNPAKGITRFKENSRERVLHPDEMPRFLQALDDHPEQDMADFFRIALFTGARRANVQSMAWSDVNFSRRVWTIPAAQAKAGDTLSVYLSDPAVDVLKRRWDTRTAGAVYVFPSHSKTGHVTEPKGAWKEILTAAGLSDLRVHDLRRTYGTWLAAGGASLHMIGRALGHKNQSTTAIYARLSIDPLKAPIENAAAAMLGTVKKPEQEDTTPKQKTA